MLVVRASHHRSKRAGSESKAHTFSGAACTVAMGQTLTVMLSVLPWLPASIASAARINLPGQRVLRSIRLRRPTPIDLTPASRCLKIRGRGLHQQEKRLTLDRRARMTKVWGAAHVLHQPGVIHFAVRGRAQAVCCRPVRVRVFQPPAAQPTIDGVY